MRQVCHYRFLLLTPSPVSGISGGVSHNPPMKRFLSLLACMAVLSLPALALDPHDAQTAAVTATTLPVSTSAAQVTSLLSLTSHAVNSGTNSYFVWANVRYSGPLGDAVHLQLYKNVSGTITVLVTKTI